MPYRLVVCQHQHLVRDHHHTDQDRENQISARESQLGETVSSKDRHKHRQADTYYRYENGVAEVFEEITHLPGLSEVVEDQLFRKETFK